MNREKINRLEIAKISQTQQYLVSTSQDFLGIISKAILNFPVIAINKF